MKTKKIRRFLVSQKPKVFAKIIFIFLFILIGIAYSASILATTTTFQVTQDRDFFELAGGYSAFVKFDLSSIPSGRRITAATFSLYAETIRVNGAHVYVGNCSNQTWVDSPNANYLPLIIIQSCNRVQQASQLVTTTGLKEWNVLEMVKANYLSGYTSTTFVVNASTHAATDKGSNANILRVYNNSASGAYFSSSEAATNRPTLVVTYAVNTAPTLAGVSISPPSPIRGGSTITISASGVGDAQSDALNLYCHNTSSVSPILHDVCSSGPFASPYSSVSCTGTAVADNSAHNVYCIMNDGVLSSPTASTSYTSDSSPPAISISSIGGDSNSPYTTADNTPLAVIATNENADCRASLDGDETYSEMSDDIICTTSDSRNHNCQFGTILDGATTMYFACRDTLGNENTAANNAQASLTVDIIAPTVGALSIYSGSSYNNYFKGVISVQSSVVDTGSGINTASCQYSINGGAWTAGTYSAGYCQANGLNPLANFNIQIRVSDNAGNTGTSSTQSYTYDITAPVVGLPEIYSGSVSGNFYSGIISIRSSMSDAGSGINTATCEYSLNGGTSWNAADYDLSGFCKKDNIAPSVDINIQFRVKDNLATIGTSAARAYTYDGSAPAVGAPEIYSGNYIGDKYVGTISIRSSVSDSGSGLDTSSCQYSLDNGATWLGATYSAPYCIKTGIAPAMNITIKFSVNDTVLNRGENLVGSFYVYDPTPPKQIAGTHVPGNDTNRNTNSLTLIFNTNEPAHCKWGLINDLAYASLPNQCSVGNSTGISCSISGLVEGKNIVYVGCTDELNNQDTAITNTELTYNVITTGPIITITKPQIGKYAYTSLGVNATLDRAAASCQYSLNSGTNISMSSSSSTIWFSSSNFTAIEGSNVITVYCTDSLGNLGVNSVTFIIDTIPPTMQNFEPENRTNLTTTSKVINFTTTENAGCRWSLADQSYDNMGAINDCTFTDPQHHSCLVKGLDQGWKKVYFACIDSAANNNSASNNVGVDYYVDSLPPLQSAHSPLNGATLSATFVTVTFSLNETGDCRWATNDLSYLNMGGDCIGDGTKSISCDVQGLIQGSQIVYFACKDNLGNADTNENNTAITYIVDNIPPTITIISPTASQSTNVTSFNVALNKNSNWCIFSLDNAGNITMNKINDTYFSYTNNSMSEGSHIMKVYCNDTLNNMASNSATFETRFDCTLTSLSITPNCAEATCNEEETISMSGTYTGNCTHTGEEANFFQIDAESTDGSCNIQYAPPGDMSGIWDSARVLTVTDPAGMGSGTVTGTWTIPSIPSECNGKQIDAVIGRLWDGIPGVGIPISNALSATGSFNLTYTEPPAPATGNYTILYKPGQFSLNWENTSTSNGRFKFGIFDGTEWKYAVSEEYNSGEWKHVIAEFNGTAVSIYVDGVKGIDILANSMQSSSENLLIGRDSGTENFFKGDIDDTKIFARALNDKEILEINSSKLIYSKMPKQNEGKTYRFPETAREASAAPIFKTGITERMCSVTSNILLPKCVV